MLTKDSEKIASHVAADRKDAQREKQLAINTEIAAKRDVTLAADDAIPTTSTEAQAGRPLTAQELMKKLKNLNPLLIFERSKADAAQMGIYVADGFSNLNDPNHRYRGVRFLCGFEASEMPEFSIRKMKRVQFYNESTEKVDERMEFAGEIRGWRTVLARLIRAGVIGQAAALKEFNVAGGRESKNWSLAVN